MSFLENYVNIDSETKQMTINWTDSGLLEGLKGVDKKIVERLYNSAINYNWNIELINSNFSMFLIPIVRRTYCMNPYFHEKYFYLIEKYVFIFKEIMDYNLSGLEMYRSIKLYCLKNNHNNDIKPLSMLLKEIKEGNYNIYDLYEKYDVEANLIKQIVNILDEEISKLEIINYIHK